MNTEETDALARIIKEKIESLREDLKETSLDKQTRNFLEGKKSTLIEMALKFADYLEKEDKERARFGASPTLGESMEFDKADFLKKCGCVE